MSPHRAPRRASGFSLVELLVATAIGLIGIVIMLQVFENAEGVRRTTMSGGDAQQNGALALFTIEADVRNAGMGMNEIGLFNPPCNMIGYDNLRTTPAFPPVGFSMVLAPVQIVPGPTATAPDQINVFYGASTVAGTTTLITPMVMASTPNPLTVDSNFGYRPGDLLLLFLPSANPTVAPQPCVFTEVTSLGTGASSNQVFHAPGAYTLSNSGASVQARFNPPNFTGTNLPMALSFGGAKTIGPGSTRVFNLGNLHDKEDFPLTQETRLPAYNTYAINNNTLTFQNMFVMQSGAPLVSAIADNIVHMRADYGLDDALPNPGDGIFDRFLDPAAFNALPTPPWRYIVSIRLVVVARSALAEKPGPGVACDGTTPFPTWSGGGTLLRGLDLSAIPLPAGVPAWDCYRYRVFETVVPVRNTLWKSS